MSTIRLMCVYLRAFNNHGDRQQQVTESK